MTDIRMLVSWGSPSAAPTDRYSNTLYFVVDLTDPDYQDLSDAVLAAYQAQAWTSACKIEVRSYNMADAKPRPERSFSTVTKTGVLPGGPGQIALCLSYYSERNLPRQRGRIYTGPYASPQGRTPTTSQMDELLDLATALSNVGGANVDWSVYSPTIAREGGDPTMSISDVWVDNSWDVVRSRKLKATTRVTREINE